MKRHNWTKYNAGEIIEITVRDAHGGKVETWRVSGQDSKRLKQLSKLLNKKYGIDFSGKSMGKDLEWLP